MLLTAFAITASLLTPVALAAEPVDDTPAIESASAQLQDGRLAAEVVTTLPVFREDLRAKLDGRTLVLYVSGAVIPGGKKSFGEGASVVRALARQTYTKIEIPFPQGASCAGTPAIALDETVIKVSVGCGGTATAPTRVVKAEALAEKLVGAPTVVAPVADPQPAPAAAVAVAKTDAVETKPVAEKIPAPVGGTIASAVLASAAKASATPIAEKLPANAPTADKVAVAEKATVAAPVAEKAPSVEIPAAKPSRRGPDLKGDLKGDLKSDLKADASKASDAGPRPASSSIPTMGLGFVLVAATVGFMFWKRRRQQHVGLIRILETASLGPKRTLVVAEIDGEKMILGTSEAGISVLTPLSRMAGPFGEATRATTVTMPPGFVEETTGTGRRADQAALVAAAATQARVSAQSARDVGADDNEGGLLARLFRRQGGSTVTETDHNLGNMEDDFRDLLTDSIEDEDLRRRLQAGLGGRIS